MSLRQILTFVVSAVILIATGVSAQHIVPSALLTIDQNEVPLSGPTGQLDDISLRDVIKAVGYVMDSDCEPN